MSESWWPLVVFPTVQLIGTVSLAVRALSYAGQFNVMVVADADGYPDIEAFVGSATEELQAWLRRPLCSRRRTARLVRPPPADKRRAAVHINHPHRCGHR